MTPGALHIYHDETLIGTLTRDHADEYQLSYSENWLSSPNAFRLSLSLPLEQQTHKGDKVRYFFGNLLPEGGVRHALARELNISPSNVYMFLAHLGRDCAGALSIIPEEETPSRQNWSYELLSDAALEKRLRALPYTPFYADLESASLSLAGAQAKLPMYHDDKGFHIPLNGAPSNCILKPDITDFPHSAINEHLCMELARAIRLPVARTRFVMVNGKLPCLAVERYDRQPGASFPTRLHQEDFCQMHGLFHGCKYEDEGGPSLADCRRITERASSFPSADKKLLLRWYLFCLLTGNMDGHSKNLSLLHDGKEWRLAPFYDLISTTFYTQLSRFPAMSPLGKRVALDSISREMWRDCAALFGVRRQQPYELLDTMREKLLATLPQVVKNISVPAGVPLMRVAQHLQEEISRAIA